MARRGEIVAAIDRKADGNDVWMLARVLETRRAYPILVEASGHPIPKIVHREPPQLAPGTDRVEVLTLPTADQAQARALFEAAKAAERAIHGTGGAELLRQVAEHR